MNNINKFVDILSYQKSKLNFFSEINKITCDKYDKKVQKHKQTV